MITHMKTRKTEFGSGTAEVYDMSSIVKDPPRGSPMIVTLEMPPANPSSMNSFGLLPGSPGHGGPPRQARLFENFDVAVETSVSEALNASRVSGST